MKQENIVLNNKNYTLYINYQNDEKRRLEFNGMTQEFWGFDFENYYQSGFWDDTCILYSLFDGDKIVSHTTVSLFKNESKTLLQLGTVMTDVDYQNQGLSRYLVERISEDFKGKNDGIFLFASETVLDFYPKFGFVAVPEFEHFLIFEKNNSISKFSRKQLDLDNKTDLKLFENLVENAIPNSQFPTKNKSLTFFYCFAYPEMSFKDSIYYIEDLDAAVVAQLEDETLFIIDIFSKNEVNLDDVINAFSDFNFKEVMFGFTPKNTQNLQVRNYKDEDLQLFVSPDLAKEFENNPLKIHLLSHT
ncbi:GNAT family N-acetyltransferase [Soonwooa sp.]|uniref:GNAT family N-acetyltransferase n=1 Tax=Soonwooa sp. TaxID=1938592 RepID=UPI002634A581|nr:GNAT family N-acetyltransferase [Soonwooa sp.]